MRIERFLCAAAAVSLAVAAPLSAQDSTLTPRDSTRLLRTATRVFDSTSLRRLPVDDPLEIPVLVPGVYGLTDPRAFSVRGGLPGDAAVYVDGALIRNGQRQNAEPLPPLLGIQSLSVTTGLAPASVADAKAGLLEIVTPAGGSDWRGGVGYRSDDPAPTIWRNVGFQRIQATAGGPLPAGFTAFAAFQLDGQRSLETQKLRDVQAPVYVISGVDTTIRQPESVGDPLSDTVDLAIPRFVQYSGYCDESRNGADCRGLEVPFTTLGAQVLTAKVQREYGMGQGVSITFLAGRRQVRDFPFTDLYNPANRPATRTSNRALILNWIHTLAQPAGRPLGLNLNVSYQTVERVSGALTLRSEGDSRDLFLLSPLDFVTDLSTVHDVTIAGTTHRNVGFLDDVQQRCVLAGLAACQDNVPFLDRNDLISAQPYRMNPYAAEQSARFPLFTSGLDRVFDLSRERRWQGRLGLSWQIGSHQVSGGLDMTRYDTRRYAGSPISTFGLDGYAENPVRSGLYIQDRLSLGSMEIVGAVRVDRFDSRALYPIVPGRISSITDTIAVSGTDTFRLQPFDPLDPAANFQRARAHSVMSPQLQMFLDAWRGATVRLGIGRQSRAPDFQSLFASKNVDLSLTDRNAAFGRDLKPGHSDWIELGARISLAVAGADGGGRGRGTTTADVALYSRNVTGEAIRLVRFSDPGGSGFPADWRVFTTTDLGKVRGIDVTVERQFSSALNGSVAFSHLGGTALDGNRTFVTASANLTFGERAPLGSLLQYTGVYSIVRVSTNRRYTPQQNSGNGLTIGDGGFDAGEKTSLPLFKTIDIRVTRAFSLGRVGGTAFMESRNLLNWTNFTDIFTETGRATNPQHRSRYVNEQVLQLESEAASNGLARTMPGTGEPAVDLQGPGVCAGWNSRSGNYAGGPADCVLLQGAERRFGNADGMYTRSEYATAFGAWYDLINSPYRFYGPGRRIRLGVALSL